MVYHQHPKGSSHTLSKHTNKNNHEFTILSRSNNPEVTSIPKMLKRSQNPNGKSNENLYSFYPINLTKTLNKYILILRIDQFTTHSNLYKYYKQKLERNFTERAKISKYPILALEKFTGLDPNEDARDFLDRVKK